METLKVINAMRSWLALATVTIAIGAGAQQTVAPAPSRIDVFAGYSYWQANGSAGGSAFSNANRGILVSGAYYFGLNLGLELIGDYHFTSGNDSMRSVSLGPILRGNSYHGFTPFLHGLAGATNMLGPGAFYSNRSELQPATWGREVTFGGGVDYALPLFHHHLNLRLFQADYVLEHVDFGKGGLADFDSGRFSTGLLWRSGAVPALPPVTFACTASPQIVFRGEPLSMIGVATNLDRHKTPTFRWTGTGVNVTAAAPVAQVETADLEPGTYTIAGQVIENRRPGRSAGCTAQFTVKPLPEPKRP